MKLFKISKNNKDYILSAQDKVGAVKKLRDAQNKSCDESLDEKERKAQEWVDYDIKHYGKVSETTKEDIRKMGLDFDKWDNQVKDSAIKDSNFDIVKNAFNKYGVDIIKVVNRQDGSKAIYFDKKDKDIYNKPEIMNLYRSGKLRYAGSGYFVEVLDSSTIRDARPDRDTIFKIERAANNIRTNNISVTVAIDSDKDGVFIKEMYINTSGKWLETPQEADAYLRDLSNAIKFLKENYKYLGK